MIRPVRVTPNVTTISLMQRIAVGHLRVLTESHIYNFPAPGSKEAQDGPSAELRVVKDSFWIR